MIGQKTVCAIDIGSQEIIAALAKVDRKGRLAAVQTEETAASGLKNGIVSDASSLSDSIHNVIQALKNKSKSRIAEVIININGNNISCRHSQATMPLSETGSKLISKSDINKVKKQARLLGLNLEEEVIHEFVQNYSIDNYGEVKNPLGLYGKKISVDLYMIVSKSNYINNILEALNLAGLEVGNLVFSGFASSLAVLSDEEIQKGCILIDIGTAITELLFFKDGGLRRVEIVPIGGNQITESIASRLKISWELAEELKKSYLTALEDEIKENEEILVKKASTYKPIRRKLLARVSRDKINELIEGIKSKIDVFSPKEQVGAGIIITGGGSLLHGLLELVELKTGIPTRLGKVKNVSVVSSKNPQYSTVIGLIYYYIENLLSKRSPFQKGQSLVSSFTEVIKHLFQEYF